MKCAECGKEITMDCHSTNYDEPPFYCSESCWGKNNKKTLKDIKEGRYEFVGLVRLDHLKAEAVKRVKYCDSLICFTRNDKCGKSLDKFPYNYCKVCRREIWLNNLTEEDLK